MKRYQLSIVVALLASLVLFCSCGYRITGHGTVFTGDSRSLWVAPLINETLSPTAQTVFRRALYEECHALRGLTPAPSEADSRFHLRGKVISYFLKPLSYTSRDRIREYRLSVELELELRDTTTKATLWKGVIPGAAVFPVDIDTSQQKNAEEAALESAARQIAQNFIASVEQSY